MKQHLFFLFAVLLVWPVLWGLTLPREDQIALRRSPSFERKVKGGSYAKCRHIAQSYWISGIGLSLSLLAILICIVNALSWKKEDVEQVCSLLAWGSLVSSLLLCTVIGCAADFRLKKWCKITKGKKHLTQREIREAQAQMKR